MAELDIKYCSKTTQIMAALSDVIKEKDAEIDRLNILYVAAVKGRKTFRGLYNNIRKQLKQS